MVVVIGPGKAIRMGGVMSKASEPLAIARKFIRKARRLNKSGTSGEVVACYREGLEIVPDDAELKYRLGHALYWGMGVPENHPDAAAHLLSAARQNNVDALNLLAIISMPGLGCRSVVNAQSNSSAVPRSREILMLWASSPTCSGLGAGCIRITGRHTSGLRLPLHEDAITTRESWQHSGTKNGVAPTFLPA
jgi:hypothetical protein